MECRLQSEAPPLGCRNKGEERKHSKMQRVPPHPRDEAFVSRSTPPVFLSRCARRIAEDQGSPFGRWPFRYRTVGEESLASLSELTALLLAYLTVSRLALGKFKAFFIALPVLIKALSSYLHFCYPFFFFKTFAKH